MLKNWIVSILALAAALCLVTVPAAAVSWYDLGGIECSQEPVNLLRNAVVDEATRQATAGVYLFPAGTVIESAGEGAWVTDTVSWASVSCPAVMDPSVLYQVTTPQGRYFLRALSQ